MPTSPFLKPYLLKIAGLNDQLWSLLFTSEELIQRLSSFSPKVLDNLTTELFQNNQYARRIRVRGSRLQHFIDNHTVLSYGAYYSSSFEIGTRYMEEIFNVVVGFNSIAGLARWSDTEPELNLPRLFSHLHITPPHHIIPTLTYLRYKRNHFIHVARSPKPAAMAFAASDGPLLNGYWITSGRVSNINFSDPNEILQFRQDMAIQLFNVLQIVLKDLDNFILPHLSDNGIIQYLLQRQYGNTPERMNAIIRKTRIENIQRLANQQFRRTIADAQFLPLVNQIGVR